VGGILLAAHAMLSSDPRLPASLPWLAAAALAIQRWHIQLSRSGDPAAFIPLLLVLALWLGWLAARSGRAAAWMGAGGVVAAPAGLALPWTAAGLVANAWLRGRPRVIHTGAWAGALVAAAFGLAALGLEGPPAPGVATDLHLGRAVAGVLGLFLVRGDPSPRFNVPGMPALDILMAIPFVLGLIVALSRVRSAVYASWLAAGIAGLLPALLIARGPDFRLGAGACVVAALICGQGLATILGSAAARTDAPVPPRLRERGETDAALQQQLDVMRRSGRAIVAAAILLGSCVYAMTVYVGPWARLAGS
jgi:hypothetical protein